MAIIGCVSHDGKFLLLPGISRGAVLSSYSCNRSQKLFCGTKGRLKSIPSCSLMRISVAYNASSNNYKRNPNFSRQQKGSSRGKSKKYQEPEQSENTEEMDLLSKNGSLLSLTSTTRYQATATPGQREKEIVELFRKVQAQLRERAAIKEEKKIEAARQGQSERGTVDSLLKLLRKHSVDQKKSGPEEDFTIDQLERSKTSEDEQNLNLFGPNDIKSEESQEPGPLPSTRPASNFRRNSPVPRVKLQPVFSAREDINNAPPKSRGRRKTVGNNESEPAARLESVVLDGADELSLDNQLDPSGSDETTEEIAENHVESSATQLSSDLGSLKLTELKDLAKSQGVKGYSKLKKGELVELLSA